MGPLAWSEPTARPPLRRRALAEALGTGLLVTVVVGSGIAAQRLSAGQPGLQLLENAVATALGLAVLIVVLGPVSGGHFNPVVSLTDAALGRLARRAGSGTAGLGGRELAAYLPAQLAGGIAGALLANLMFDLPAATLSTTPRSAGHLWLAEVVATAGLVLVIFALARSGLAARSLGLAAGSVGAYIGAAYFFTSSTSFANPAVTIGRIFSDTFAGISPGSVPPFLAAQLLGAATAGVLIRVLYPDEEGVS